jgi:hypothetical protein
VNTEVVGGFEIRGGGGGAVGVEDWSKIIWISKPSDGVVLSHHVFDYLLL